MPESLVFGAADLRRCRFAISPLWETFAAVHLLFEPHRHAFHLPWVRRAVLPADLDLGPLQLLMPRPGYVPDFLTPPPTGPTASIDEELDRLLATPEVQVADGLRESLLDPRRGLPSDVTGPMLADPAATRDLLAELLRACWNLLVLPHWPRLRALLEADIATRSRVLAEGGLERMFAELHQAVSWEDDRLRVTGHGDATRRLSGEGVLLMPSAFIWPELVLMSAPPWQPTVIYPARGIGDLWAPGARRPPEALAAVLGGTRAALLCALGEPATTTSLAASHGISPATVSHSLRALRDVGLLESWRVGRRVFYARTPMGSALTGADPGL